MPALATVQIDDHSESWERLEKSSQWAALTAPQKLWVVVFVATGSALEATKTAYKAKSEVNARVLSYELAKNPKIIAALDAAQGVVRSERDMLVAEVKAQLRAAERGSIAASKLAAQLERLLLPGVSNAVNASPEAEDSSAETPKIQFHVGQRVTQRDTEGILHTGIVKAIGQDGLPIQIEEIQS